MINDYVPDARLETLEELRQRRKDIQRQIDDSKYPRYHDQVVRYEAKITKWANRRDAIEQRIYTMIKRGAASAEDLN